MSAPNFVFVPKSALITTAERTYVICIANSHTNLVDVQQSDENHDQVPIFSKLNADDVVLKNYTKEITDQQAMQVAIK